MPIVVGLIWKFYRYFSPQPGQNTLTEQNEQLLTRYFDTMCAAMRDAMVPSHNPQADCGKNLRNIDLGAAKFVITKAQKSLLSLFLSQRQVNSNKNIEQFHSRSHHVLLVTGEPGAGKSVLMQELYTAISSGVSSSCHSLIPLLIFARDIHIDLVNDDANNLKWPLREFLTRYYEEKLEHSPPDERFRGIANFLRTYWDRQDFIVFIDGLDEIPQRTNYQTIQDSLVKLIDADLVRCSHESITHKFILTCRVDEDLNLFQGASSIFLEGLSDKRLVTFCNNLINNSGLTSTARDNLECLLGSSRLVPSQVFNRNPYFLTLLLHDAKRDASGPRNKIDFDFLMREYLKRDSQRQHVGVGTGITASTDQRIRIFTQLENVSQWFLQASAFKSAYKADVYNETNIDLDFFMVCIEENLEESTIPSAWQSLRNMLLDISEPSVPRSLNDQKFNSIFNHLDILDIQILKTFEPKLRTSNIDAFILREAIEDIAKQQLLESKEWYDELTENFLELTNKYNNSLFAKLGCVFCFRSFVAAHALRIIYVEQNSKNIVFKFRHRRLAEFYAAKYLNDQWLKCEPKIDLHPWLGPILNLTCALQGSSCQTLSWMIQQIDTQIGQPYHKWRHVVDVTVEAAFFSHPGESYRYTLQSLVEKVLRVENYFSDNPDRIYEFAVTRIVLLRKMEHIGRLNITLDGHSLAINNQLVEKFFESLQNTSAEWISRMLPAAIAIELLTVSKLSTIDKIDIYSRLIQSPSSVILVSSGSAKKQNVLLRRFMIAFIVCGEFLIWMMIIGAIYFLISGLGWYWELQYELVDEFKAILLSVSIGSLLLLRAFSWFQSPTKAMRFSSLFWKLTIPVIFMPHRFVSSFTIAHLNIKQLFSISEILEELTYIRLNALKFINHSILVIAKITLVLGILLSVLLLVSSYLPDPKPSPHKIEVSVYENNVREIYDYTISPQIIEPEDSPLGSLTSLFLARQVKRETSTGKKYLNWLKNLDQEKLDSVVYRIILNKFSGDIKDTKQLTEVLGRKVNAHEKMHDTLSKRNRVLLFYSATILILIFASIRIIVFIYQTVNDRKHINKLNNSDNIDLLFQQIKSSSNSERVRRLALFRLRSRDMQSNALNRLEQIERLAGQFVASSSDIDKVIGADLSDYVDTLSKRIRNKSY